MEAFKLNPEYPYLKGAIRFIKNTLCEWDDYEKELKKLENDIRNKKKVTTLAIFICITLIQLKRFCLSTPSKKLI